MKLFSGFPAGKVAVTPLPNLFFSELLPALDDLAELKVTLHVFWLIANSKTLFVRASDLRADRTLAQSLKACGASLGAALERAVERGALLCFNADDALYFVNTERGRRAFEKMQSEGAPRGNSKREPVSVVDRPNVFALYEQNIGLLTPIIAEQLTEAEAQYPAAWIAEALQIAVENNKRSWSYARKILERWQTEGREKKSKKKSWYGDEYAKLVKR